MRRYFSELHGGQLIMAWVGLFIVAVLLGVGALMGFDAASDAPYRHELARRDSLARVPETFGKIEDSVQALESSGEREWQIIGYLRAAGLQDSSFRAPTASELRRATLLRYTVAYPMILALIALPLFGWWMTWVWLGARRRSSA